MLFNYMQSVTLAKTRKVGGSLVVTIPKEIVELERLHESELVEIHIKKVKKSYRGILRGISPLKKSDKLDVHEDYS